MKNLCSGTHRGGFQFLLILDLWGISSHAVVVFGLGKNLLFKTVLGHCVVISHEIAFISVLAPLLKGIHLFDWDKKGNLLWWFFVLSFAVLQYFTSDSIKHHINSVLLFIVRNSKSDGSPKIQRKYREITYSCSNITTTLIQIPCLFYFGFFSKTNHYMTI